MTEMKEEGGGDVVAVVVEEEEAETEVDRSTATAVLWRQQNTLRVAEASDHHIMMEVNGGRRFLPVAGPNLPSSIVIGTTGVLGLKHRLMQG